MSACKVANLTVSRQLHTRNSGLHSDGNFPREPSNNHQTGTSGSISIWGRPSGVCHVDELKRHDTIIAVH